MATSEKMTTFRLATINVHTFRRPSNRAINIEDLVSILKPLDLNLIAVQEVHNNYQWKKFCQDMSLPYTVYGTYAGNIADNAIASSHPITSHSNKQSTLICPGGIRYFLQCSLNGFEKLKFAVTHLDYIDEDNRLKQIKQFNPYEQNIDIFMGDMNALTREDYSDRYYQKNVLETRQASHWEKPRFDLTKLITDEWGYQDAFRSFNPQLKDEQVSTCRFGTRIDYIYVHPRIYDQWKLTKCEIIDTEKATDHNIVFAEFELKSK
jgi:endonuclease/exonuclease/phosphatase family metal-dependent hydrolase